MTKIRCQLDTEYWKYWSYGRPLLSRSLMVCEFICVRANSELVHHRPVAGLQRYYYQGVFTNNFHVSILLRRCWLTVKCLISCVMCEQPLNSMIFSPCSYFFIIVNYWAACQISQFVQHIRYWLESWDPPSASFCEVLFANSQIFNKAELFIWTNCFRPVSTQSWSDSEGKHKQSVFIFSPS